MNSNCLEYVHKNCHLQAALEQCLPQWRSQTWEIPSKWKYCRGRTLLLFPLFSQTHLLPVIEPKENLPNGMTEQEGWECLASLFSVSLGVLISFTGVYIPSWTTNSPSIGAAFAW